MARKGKTKKTRGKAGGGLKEKIKSGASSLLNGKSGSTGKRRNRGPAYWANKVIVARLKAKYFKLKYSGMR